MITTTCYKISQKILNFYTILNAPKARTYKITREASVMYESSLYYCNNIYTIDSWVCSTKLKRQCKLYNHTCTIHESSLNQIYLNNLMFVEQR
jgi:hypothetical protein